jgi:hypothetical protein
MLKEVLVGPFPDCELTAIELTDSISYGLQEAPVVGDQDNGATKIFELLLKPDNRGYVEVVGWLIEQQEVGFRHQCSPQRYTPAPPARQILEKLRAVETELSQRGLHAILQCPSIASVESVLDICHLC